MSYCIFNDEKIVKAFPGFGSLILNKNEGGCIYSSEEW